MTRGKNRMRLGHQGAVLLAILASLISGFAASQISIIPALSHYKNPQQSKPVIELKAAKVAAEASQLSSAFNDWCEQYVNSSNAEPLVSRGVELAAKRRGVLKELMTLDPKRALELAVSSETRRKMPTEVQSSLEEHISAYGDYIVVVSDQINRETGAFISSRTDRTVEIRGKTYQASVYGRWLQMTSKNNIPINGIIIDDLIAVNESPVRTLSPDELAQSASTQAGRDREIVVDIGGEIRYFTSEYELSAFVQALVAREMMIGPDTEEHKGRAMAQIAGGLNADSTWTEGPKTVLIMRVDFSDKPGEPMDAGNQPLTISRGENLINNEVSPFYVNSSYNKTSQQVTVTPVVRLPQTLAFYEEGNNYSTMLVDARTAARSAGFETNNFNLDIVAFSHSSNFTWAGRGSLGGKGTWLNGYFDLRVTSHELGHNYGLHHANLWQTNDGSVIGQGTDIEYGDSFDAMGGAGGSQMYHFNARYKRTLEWLIDNNVQTITQDGVYRVTAQDSSTAGGIRVLRVRKNAEKDYWIEFRQLFTNIPNAMNGAIVRWDYLSGGLRRTQLLDMTPATGNTSDAPLLIGQSFDDNEDRIKFTVVGKGGTTPESLDVRVELNVGCTFGLGQTSQNFTASGGEGSIPVNTQTGCKPPAAGNDGWLFAINSDVSPVRYIVAANYEPQPRTGTLTVAGQTFTVTQAGATTDCVPRPSGLVAWWQGEGNAVDQTGANHGSVMNNLTFAGGMIGGGFSNFGNSAGVVEVPDTASLALTRSMTFEGWLKLNSHGGTVISRRINIPPFTRSYDVFMGTNGILSFVIWTSAGGFSVSSDALPLGQFVHFAAELDDSTNLFKMYINGALVRQFTLTQRPNSVPGATTRIAQIDGITDELSVYDRALSGTEIQALYNAGTAATGAAGKCPSLSSIPVNVLTNPAGRSFVVDGTTYTSAQTFAWIPGSNHTISTSSPQAGAAGTQFAWSDWSDGGGISHTVSPTNPITYTANFTTQYLLTMNAGSSGTVSPTTGYFNSGQSVNISATPNAGFSFNRWTGSGSGSFSGTTNPATVTMNGPITETASFTQLPSQITVQTNPAGRSFTVDGTTYSTPQTFSWIPGSSHTISTTSPQSGTTGTQYVWSSWSDGGAVSHSVMAPSSNTTYTANFTTQFFLTMNASGGGAVTPVSGFFNSGQMVNISATPNAGFSFTGWTGSGSGSFTGTMNPATVTMNGPITETAAFTQIPSGITVQTNPTGRSFAVDGTTYSTTQTFSWTPGSVHTIVTTSPQSGTTGTQYVWSSWSDGGAIAHSITAPSGSAIYTANFTTQHFLTMNAGSGGTVSPSSGFFNSGQSVNISATPNTGFSFSGWTGSGSGSFTGSSNPASVTMTGPITETASFITTPSTVQFNAAASSISEGAGFANITATRSGGSSGAASVSYATSNGTGKEGTDYTAAFGVINFAAGETSKTFPVLIIDNAYVDGARIVNLALTNPTGATLGTQSTAALTINDNDLILGTNPLDVPRSLVQYSYYDFLGRYPDASGWDFWTNQITNCGSNVQCVEVRRIDVSASFFLSIEFQQTGYLVERFYKVAYGSAPGNSTFGGNHTLPVPVIRFDEFLRDSQRIGRGVIVLAPGWEQLLESNKQVYALEFVQIPRFISAFPISMTPTEFVDKLNQNAGNVLSVAERTTAINLFGGAANSSSAFARAQVVRQVAEDLDLYNAEVNRAFVLAEYFGYLRRNPNDPPDNDYTGYDFWLTKLNQFNGNYIQAEMVKAFLSSIEYRQRFGP